MLTRPFCTSYAERCPLISLLVVKTDGRVRRNPAQRHWRQTKLKP
ncbi:MAG: hypothetical protein ACXADL_11840 [Candidatus Thorarchaeota archaeon]